MHTQLRSLKREKHPIRMNSTERDVAPPVKPKRLPKFQRKLKVLVCFLDDPDESGLCNVIPADPSFGKVVLREVVITNRDALDKITRVDGPEQIYAYYQD